VTLVTTSAVQWAKKKELSADALEHADAARASVQELYATILLYGQGPLREEYRKKIHDHLQRKATLVELLPVLGKLDNKAEHKFKRWTLVWL
jgi:cyanate lyase